MGSRAEVMDRALGRAFLIGVALGALLAWWWLA